MYGLVLHSVRELPGITVSSLPRPPWTVRLPGFVPDVGGETIRRPEDDDNPDAVTAHRLGDAAVHLSFADGTQFAIDARARTIVGAWPPHFSFEDALVYLVGPVLGATVRMERRSILHASAVERTGRALLLLGSAGAGKSTLTAACLDRGFRLVTEDVSAIDVEESEPAVFRGGHRVKLWSESVIGLRGRADALPALVPSSVEWTKQFLDAASQLTTRERVPIEAILLLTRDAGAAAPRLERLRAGERMLALLANGYATRFVLPDDREADLARIATLARTVPILRLVLPDNLARLGDVVALLEATEWSTVIS